MKTPLILHIESSGLNCSVALAADGKYIAGQEEKSDHYIHAERLHVFIQETLENSGVQAKDLDAIAVDYGPGSYTGLRIGVSAAKGMAYSLAKPLILLDSLEILHQQSTEHDKSDFVVCMQDARRMEVYCSVFAAQERKTMAEAVVLSENSFDNYLSKGTVLFLGDSNQKVQEIIRHENAIFPESTYPSARNMISLAKQKYTSRDFADLAYSEPFYLKDFIPGKAKGN